MISGGWEREGLEEVFDSRIGDAADRLGGDSGEADLHALLQGSSTGVDLGDSAAKDLGEEVATWEGLRRPKQDLGDLRGWEGPAQARQNQPRELCSEHMVV